MVRFLKKYYERASVKEKAMAVCPVCEDAITNPICEGCLDNEINQWFIELKLPAKSEGKKLFKFYPKTKVQCVSCHKNLKVCAHCVCREAFYYVYDLNSLELSEEFVYTFDFQIHQCLN